MPSLSNISAAATAPLASSSQRSKLTLTTLEPEILTHIIEFLLDAPHVRHADNPPNTTDIRYAFQPAVMRTCKSLHAVATRVFHRNHFVRVKTSSMTLRDIIKNNSVHIWQRKINKFQHSHLHLTISTKRPLPNDTARKQIVFLICSDAIEGLTWSLRLADLFYQPGYSYTIRIGKNADGTNLSHKMQRLLLEPLHQVKNGPYATCTIIGVGDVALKEETEKLLSPRILWTRSRLWEFLDAVAFKQAAANKAFANGSMLEAHALHHDLELFCDNLWPIRKQILEGDDPRLTGIWLHLDSMITINFGLVELHHHWDHGELAAVEDGFDTILHQAGHKDIYAQLSRRDQAKLYFLCGAGQLFHGWAASLRESFGRALELFPDNSHYQTCAAIAETYPFTPFHPGVGKHMQDIQTVMAMLPKQPLSCWIPPGVSLLPSIDFERHVLQALGYTGDLLEGRVEQKPGWSYHWTGERQASFDSEMADSFIKFHQDHIDVYDPADYQGLPMAIWVKPPYVQLEGLEGRGEEIMRSHASAVADGYDHHHHQEAEHPVTVHVETGSQLAADLREDEIGQIDALQDINHSSLDDGHEH